MQMIRKKDTRKEKKFKSCVCLFACVRKSEKEKIVSNRPTQQRNTIELETVWLKIEFRQPLRRRSDTVETFPAPPSRLCAITKVWPKCNSGTVRSVARTWPRNSRRANTEGPFWTAGSGNAKLSKKSKEFFREQYSTSEKNIVSNVCMTDEHKLRLMSSTWLPGDANEMWKKSMNSGGWVESCPHSRRSSKPTAHVTQQTLERRIQINRIHTETNPHSLYNSTRC